MSSSFKLVSRKGTLLGTVSIPDGAAQYLHDRSHYFAKMSVLPRLRLPPYPSPEVSALVDVQTVTFVRSHAYRDAIEIHGISLEEFEKLPGCSFAPGAGYLRSIVTEGGA